MFRFRISTLLISIALIAVSLGWIADHLRLTRRLELINNEATMLATREVHYLMHLPLEAQLAKNKWIRRSPGNLNFDTYEQRQANRDSLAFALEGIAHNRIQFESGMNLDTAIELIKKFGFQISESDESEPSQLVATRQGRALTSTICIKFKGDQVIDFD